MLEYELNVAPKIIFNVRAKLLGALKRLVFRVAYKFQITRSLQFIQV